MVDRTGLPEWVVLSERIVLFTDINAAVSDCFSCLQVKARLASREKQRSNISNEAETLFAFPDSSEWGTHFTEAKSAAGMEYLGIDTAFNSYWSATRNSKNDLQYGDQAIFAYDKHGHLLYWFPEPKNDPGWRYYAGGIVVDELGSLYQMTFYSMFSDFGKRIQKSKIDTTKGIRIIEYIPEKKDFSHEARVKMYGGKH